ncbi:MAG: glycosyltransferase family 39 protein [Candidatus Eremiobacteraeota bacterium]|nr:glycosyltransferase family 39 protein [Candidatus Eremiobacteraeota bacterium]
MNDTKTKPPQKEKSSIPFIFFIYILLATSCVLSGRWLVRNAGIFADILTSNYGANWLFDEIAEPTNAFQQFLTRFLIPHFIKFYVVGVYLILGIGILIILAICFLSKKSIDIPGWMILPDKYRKAVLYSLCVTAFLAMVIIAYSTRSGNLPFDEFSYVLQSKLMLSGKLHAESPPMREFYQTAHIINNGKWYSKYTLGWPLLLIPGMLLKIPLVVNPIIAMVTMLMIFLLARFLYDEKTAFISLFAVLLMPAFILCGATMMNHTSAGLFAVLLVYSVFRDVAKNSMKWHILTAISAAMLVNIRPVDAALVCIPTFLYLLFSLIKSKDRKNVLSTIVSLGFGLLLGGLFLGIGNYIQNGSFTKLSFSVYNPDEKWGFKMEGHTPIRGLWNVIYSVLRMTYWTVPFFLELSILALFEKKRKTGLIWWIFPCYLLFFIGYYTIGGGEHGSRYLYVGYILLSVPFARGLILLGEFIKNRIKFKGFSYKLFIPASIIIMLFFIYPQVYKNTTNFLSQYYIMDRMEKNVIPPDQKSLVFLFHSGFVDTMNYPDLKADNLRVIFLEPEKNSELIKSYSDRKPYVYYFDFARQSNVLVPYSNELIESPEKSDKNFLSWAYFNAGLNYEIRVGDSAKSEQCFLRAIELDPDNMAARLNLSFNYYKKGDLKKAEKSYSNIIKQNPNITTPLYYLGRIEGKQGNYKKAVSYLNEYIKREKQGKLKSKAVGWVVYYNKIGQ